VPFQYQGLRAFAILVNLFLRRMADTSTLSSGIRCRAYPDDRLCELLPQWIGCQRVLYNAKVAEDRERATAWNVAKRKGLNPPSTPPDQAYSHLKTEDKPWLKDVPSVVLRNGAYRFRVAKQRQLQGLAKRPRKRKRHDFDSVMLTRELFRFLEVRDKNQQFLRHDIEIGTAARPVGVIRFIAGAPYQVPASIVVRRTSAGHWFVSFNFEHASDVLLRTREELAYELNNLGDEALGECTLGLDRNVADNCVAASDGTSYGFSPQQLERMRRKEVGRKRYQRRMARAEKDSANRRKLKVRVARKAQYAKEVRKDFAHQTSHRLVKSSARLFVLEDLRIAQMTKAPAPKQDEKGRYLPNGASAKAGLNRSILQSSWGLTAQCLGYKAERANKLVVKVPAQYSSQECSRCGHTSPDNRPTRARFVCTACGFTAHADANAAKVLVHRGIQLLRSGALEAPAKPSKRVAFRRKPTGAGGPGVPVERMSDASTARRSGLGAIRVEAGTLGST
jgi:putative transposase